MGELSLRHIPDLSDMSSVGDFSESSFQIPSAAHDADDLLLADETMEFFSGANDTLNTPVPPSRPLVQPPLTLDELTPVSKPSRAPIRSSLRPRPGITTPYRATVAHEISAALEHDRRDTTCRIASPQHLPPYWTRLFCSHCFCQCSAVCAHGQQRALP